MQKNEIYATDASRYTCLADFVLRTKLQRPAETYLPYLMQSVSTLQSHYKEIFPVKL